MVAHSSLPGLSVNRIEPYALEAVDIIVIEKTRV